ncbi:MAG TPA: CHAT domain-containing protein [Kofleriaceae bacterium]|nr:CHAT domain-containing protein [Kofleriaceae bacterium]
MGRTGLCALVALSAACGTAASASDSCSAAIDRDQDDAKETCVALFGLTAQPAIGARAARVLAERGEDEGLVAGIASTIGDDPGGADAWNALGDIYSAAGDDRAIAAYQRALVHRDPSDLRGRTLDARGLYRRYGAINDFTSAMRYAGLAYELSARLGDSELRGRVLVGISAILYDMGDLPAAQSVMTEADRIVDRQSPFWATLHELHGVVDLAHGRYRIAEQELAEVIAFARERQLVDVLHDATMNLADAQIAAGDLDAAATTINGDPDRDHGPVSRAWHASVAARLALARGRPNEAIDIIQPALRDAPPELVPELEGTLGRALDRDGHRAEAEIALKHAVDLLLEQRRVVDIDALKPWVIEQQRQWIEDLLRIYAEESRADDALALVQAATARSIVDGLASLGSNEVGDVKTELGTAGERAAGVRALAHSLRSSALADPLAPKTLRERLSDQYVLTYARAGDDLWLIASTPQARRIVRLGSVGAIRELIEQWLSKPDDRGLGARVGNALLPALVMPPREVPIYVATDDPIREVPFAALLVDGGYLVQRNAVAYVPSANVLAVLEDLPAQNGPVVVIGDAAGDLPSAHHEVVDVAKTLGVSAHVGNDARSDALSSGASLVHIAVHAARTGRGPALLLADGPLDSGQIVDRRVNAAVVVLTSCAVADPRDRDELGPLANAFLAGGATAVVAARWSVDDDVAYRFARHFYEAGGAYAPVEATRAAQRALIAEGVDSTTWATFVVLGPGPSPKNEKER